MLTAQKIENDDYCINDIADLMMRYQKAYKSIEYMVTELMKIDSPNYFVKEAYQVGVNALAGMIHEHDCCIESDENGIYQCSCDLIPTKE